LLTRLPSRPKTFGGLTLRYVLEPLALTSDRFEISAETAPEAITRTAESFDRLTWFQFSQPLPPRVFSAVAKAAASSPRVAIRAYGKADASLAWLAEFPKLSGLAIDLYGVTSFEPVSAVSGVRKLGLGDTARKTLSLSFLSEMTTLEQLSIEGHGRDLDVVAGLQSLWKLNLRVPRTKTLDPLRGHPSIQALTVVLGGIRDLAPLREIPKLRGLSLWGVRKLDTGDVEPIADCSNLVVVSVGALRNVRDLAPLAGSPRQTLRYLQLDGMRGLETLCHLAGCERLEQIHLVDSRPADRRLDFVAAAPALDQLYVGDVYSKQAVAAALEAFKGTSFAYRGRFLRGEGIGQEVAWRRPVDQFLAAPSL
jgi:hypothetical protein